MRLVTYRRRTASGGTGSIGALSDGGVLDLGAVAGSMLELLVADGLDAARRAIDRRRRRASHSTRWSSSLRCRGRTRSATSCSSRST